MLGGEAQGVVDDRVVVCRQSGIATVEQQSLHQLLVALVDLVARLERHRPWLVVGALAQPDTNLLRVQLLDVVGRATQVRLDDRADLRVFSVQVAHDLERHVGLGVVLHVDAHEGTDLASARHHATHVVDDRSRGSMSRPICVSFIDTFASRPRSARASSVSM